MSTLQQVAGAAGTALFVTVMSLASVEAAGGADVAGTRAAFRCAAVIATVALPVTLLIRRRPTGAAAERSPVG